MKKGSKINTWMGRGTIVSIKGKYARVKMDSPSIFTGKRMTITMFIGGLR